MKSQSPMLAVRNDSPLLEIQRQIMWNRLLAVVEEQSQTLVRTGFSTSTREAGDVSAGVFDLQGRMLAQAITGTPGHVNSMALSVHHFLRKFPVATMKPGDVYATNDPWLATGHLNDFTVVTPTFRRGELVALFASTCHVVDIGGIGVATDGRDVYQEGLNIPILRLAEGGQMKEDLLDIVRANVREPVQVVGDLYSLAACNDTGSSRLVAMMDEFKLDSVHELGEYLIDRSRAGMLAEIRKLRPGVYKNAMRIDGYDHPLDLVATMTIGPTGIDVDMTGTSGISAFGVNVPHAYCKAYASFGIKCIVAPMVPNNTGSLETMRVSAPEQCVLNALPPAAVAARHVVGQMLPDVMFGCLEQAVDHGVPAEGTSCLWNLNLFGGSGRVDGDPEALAKSTAFNVLSFNAGGVGARPNKDGLSATAFPSGVKNVPIEITEMISPVVFWRKEYRQDSGGAGQFRGGLGQIMEIGNIEPVPFAVGAQFDRVEHAPRGRQGGGSGQLGAVHLGSGALLKAKGRQTIPAGDTLVLEMPGGGGHGNPRNRDPQLVADDVRNGFVSVERARSDYGVVLNAEGQVDIAATARVRGKGRAAD
jgi:N-methylhydantoinase B